MSELIEYTNINSWKSRAWFRRNNMIAIEQKHDEHGTSFQSFLKINHMLITRLIRIWWQLTTPNQLVSPSKFCSFKFFFFFGHWGTVFLFSKVINSFKQPSIHGPTCSGKAFFTKRAWHQSRRNFYAQFSQSLQGMIGTWTPFGMHTWKKKKHLHF